MAVTTWCVETDVREILSDASVDAFADDNSTGKITTAETAHITNAINRAASQVNFFVENGGYTLSDLTGNEWLKWCNAVIAVWHLSRRRLLTPHPSAEEDRNETIEQLTAIQRGEQFIPESTRSHETGPTVSNYNVERGHRDGNIIRVNPEISTGSAPASGIKRETTTI